MSTNQFNPQWSNLNLDPLINNFFQWNYQSGPYHRLQQQLRFLIDDLATLKQALIENQQLQPLQLQIERPLRYFLQTLINFKNKQPFDLPTVYETLFNMVQSLKINFATQVLSWQYPDQPLIYHNYILDLLTYDQHLSVANLMVAINDHEQISAFCNQFVSHNQAKVATKTINPT